MKQLIDELCDVELSKADWHSSPFYKLTLLNNDSRGEVGEQIISQIFHKLDYNIQEDCSTTVLREDGHYDLKVDNQRIEIKTSINTSFWQHEPLYYADVCDIVIFLDFRYNDFVITICKREDLPLKEENVSLFGKKKGTLRKNKDDGYKLDFSLKTFSVLEQTDNCKVFLENASIEEMAQFIKRWWDANV